MALNTNAQANAFANNYARVGSDTVVKAYATMKRVVQIWTGQNVAAVIPNDALFLDDGSAVGGHLNPPDGRVPIQDSQIQTMISNMNTLIASFEANSNLILNQFLQISVNGDSQVP